MNEKIGIELLKQVCNLAQKDGHNPWERFISIDAAFIAKHFGNLAAVWALQQRDLDMTNMITRIQTIPLVKSAISAVQKQSVEK